MTEDGGQAHLVSQREHLTFRERSRNLKNLLLQFEGNPILLQPPKAFDPLGHPVSPSEIRPRAALPNCIPEAPQALG